MKRREFIVRILLGLIGSILGRADRKGGPVVVPTRCLSKAQITQHAAASFVRPERRRAHALLVAASPRLGRNRTSRHTLTSWKRSSRHASASRARLWSNRPRPPMCSKSSVLHPP